MTLTVATIVESTNVEPRKMTWNGDAIRRWREQLDKARKRVIANAKDWRGSTRAETLEKLRKLVDCGKWPMEKPAGQEYTAAVAHDLLSEAPFGEGLRVFLESAKS
jgi:hypothetical protein